MIVSAETVMELPEFSGQTETVIASKLKAIELLIRAYTNNNFQNRFVRFCAASLGDRLFGMSAFLKVGDTVQISQSQVNDGLYTVTELNDENGFVRINGDLFTVEDNLVTKVEYPADVKNGVIEMLKWEIQNRDKAGIQSETLSRHSVTYQGADSQYMGYPVTLLGFLKPYMKARF